MNKFKEYWLSKDGYQILHTGGKQIRKYSINAFSDKKHAEDIRLIEYTEYENLLALLRKTIKVAKDLNLYAIHSRVYDGCPIDECDCGLTSARDALKEIEKDWT
jgi:hypothetical protein